MTLDAVGKVSAHQSKRDWSILQIPVEEANQPNVKDGVRSLLERVLCEGKERTNAMPHPCLASQLAQKCF